MRLKISHLIILFLFFSQFSISQNGSLLSSFNPGQLGFGIGDGVTDGYIKKALVQNDGKIIIIGSQNSYNNYYNPGTFIPQSQISRILPNGRIDSSFNIGTGFNITPSLNDFCIQPDGKIIVAGNFTSLNGSACNRIVRLNPNGSIDNTFNIGSGFNDIVNRIVLQPDGKILVIGEFNQYNGYNRNSIVRLNNNGSIDLSFIVGTGISTFQLSMDIKLQTDGKIIVCGDIGQYNGTAVNRIFRLTPTGAIDNTFSIGSGPNARVNTLLIQPDGKYLITGLFTTFNSVSTPHVLRLNNDGSIDGTFASPTSGITGNIYTTSMDSINRLYLCGSLTSYNGTGTNYAVRLNELGAIDNTFNSQMNGACYGVLSLEDTTYIPFGMFTSWGNEFHGGLLKFNQSDVIEQTFNPNTGTNGLVAKISQAPNNKLYVAGSFIGYNGKKVYDLIRITKNGILDPSFNPVILEGYSNLIYDVLSDQNDKVLVGGSIYATAGLQNHFFRLNSDGSNDLSFAVGTGFNGSVLDIELQPDNKILVGGGFYSYNSNNANYIIRLNTDGSIDNTFATGTGFNNYVYGIKYLSNGKIVVFGDFTNYNGTPVNRIVLLNANGTIDNSFNVVLGPNDGIRKALELPNGNLLIGGIFTTWDGIPAGNVVEMNLQGSIVNNIQFGTGFNGAIYDIEQQSNGKLLFAGQFSNYNGVNAQNVIRIYSDGAIDSSNFESYSFTSGLEYVLDVSLLDTNIILGGNFVSINGSGINRVGGIQNCVAITGYDTLTVCDSIQWIDGITYYSSQDSIRTSIINAHGCDSIVYLNLTVNHSTYAYDFQQSCPGYIWPITGQTYDTSGLFVGTIQNSMGCDSIITLVLTIYPTHEVYDTLVACDSLVWLINNNVLTSSGNYLDTLMNIYGCDSIVHLNLTLYTSYHDTIDISSCDSYYWNETSTLYYTTGIYEANYTTSNGCDSIITLNYNRLHSDSLLVQVTTCDPSYLWSQNNTAYMVSGLYSDTLSNSYGCDSIVYLELNLLQANPPQVISQFIWNTPIDSCLGSLVLNITGNSPYSIEYGGNTQIVNSSSAWMDSLCEGPLDLQIIDYCSDTLLYTVYIPSDSSFIFNNPVPTISAVDSLGVQYENCLLDYSTIDTAYIDSIWANGNTVHVIWAISNASGTSFDSCSYQLNNGTGVYWLQLNLYCPTKLNPEYFSITEAIYWNNGSVSTASVGDLSEFSVLIYPNPFNQNIEIQCIGSFFGTLIDVFGKTVLSFEGFDSHTIETGQLASGAYFAIVEYAGKKEIIKLIKP